MIRRALRAAAVAFVTTTPLAAQALHGSAGVETAWVRTASRLGATAEALSGVAIGGEGRLRIGRVMVDLAYREGSLMTADDADSRDYAEGYLLARVAPVTGLVVSVGPHARAYITNTGTQRWLFWTARLRGEHTLIAPAIAGYVELWTSLGANVNVSETFDGAQGGEVGMTAQLARSPFWGRLAYGIERARLGGGTRLETVEGITVAVGFGRR